MTSETMVDAEVQFYLPASEFPGGVVPQSLDEYWTWAAAHTGVGENGRFTWTLKTCLYLRSRNRPVRLVTTFPSRGIVVSHRDYLPLHLRPRPDVFLVCIKPDRKEHSWAHFYVVQNPQDRIFSGPLAHRARQIMHWPQPHLRPRAAQRAGHCENVRYFGRPVNLAPELTDARWTEELRGLGFDWRVVPATQWNDYSEVDVTVSVRAFDEADGARDPLLDPHSKPPSKLINSWIAGVPAIVGRESAYRSVYRTALDYLEAASKEEVLAALKRLRADRGLYTRMVANGLERAKDFDEGAVCSQWEHLIDHDLVPAYRRWIRMSVVTRVLLTAQSMAWFLATPGNLTGFRWHRQPTSA